MRLNKYFPHIDDSDDSDLDPEGVPLTMLDESHFHYMPKIEPPDSLAHFAQVYSAYQENFDSRQRSALQRMAKGDGGKSQYMEIVRSVLEHAVPPEYLKDEIINIVKTLDGKTWAKITVLHMPHRWGAN